MGWWKDGRPHGNGICYDEYGDRTKEGWWEVGKLKSSYNMHTNEYRYFDEGEWISRTVVESNAFIYNYDEM